MITSAFEASQVFSVQRIVEDFSKGEIHQQLPLGGHGLVPLSCPLRLLLVDQICCVIRQRTLKVVLQICDLPRLLGEGNYGLSVQIPVLAVLQHRGIHARLFQPLHQRLDVSGHLVLLSIEPLDVAHHSLAIPGRSLLHSEYPEHRKRSSCFLGFWMFTEVGHHRGNSVAKIASLNVLAGALFAPIQMFQPCHVSVHCRLPCPCLASAHVPLGYLRDTFLLLHHVQQGSPPCRLEQPDDILLPTGLVDAPRPKSRMLRKLCPLGGCLECRSLSTQEVG